MAGKRGLGKGLGALIPQAPTRKVDSKATENKEKQEKLDNTDKIEQEEKPEQSNPAKNKKRVAGEKKNTTSSRTAAKKTSSTSAAKAEDAKETGLEAKASSAPTKDEKPDISDHAVDVVEGNKAESAQEAVLRSMQYLPVTSIEPNPEQPRKTFQEEALEDLTASIRAYGILQPIVVQKFTMPGHAPYQIIAGERRYRAAQRAGLTEVPVVLREDHLEETALLSVVENVQRQDLTPVEEAVAYREIMQDRAMTQQELAEALGKSRPYVANTMRLLQLDEESLNALRDGRLTSSQGRTLLAEKDLKKRAAYRKLLLEGRSSVKDVEKRRKKAVQPNLFLNELEERMAEALGTNVAIVPRRKGWSVQVACYNEEELNRLLSRLLGEAE